MLGSGIPRTVDDLARRIARDTADHTKFELARDAAEAMLELAQVWRFKAALIESAARLGGLDLETAWLIRRSRRRSCSGGPIKAGSQWRVSAACRGITANRRDGALCLPALLRLQRYETRAAAKRDQAIRKLAF